MCDPVKEAQTTFAKMIDDEFAYSKKEHCVLNALKGMSALEAEHLLRSVLEKVSRMAQASSPVLILEEGPPSFFRRFSGKR